MTPGTGKIGTCWPAEYRLSWQISATRSFSLSHSSLAQRTISVLGFTLGIDARTAAQGSGKNIESQVPEERHASNKLGK
jgi:hypothetical protein